MYAVKQLHFGIRKIVNEQCVQSLERSLCLLVVSLRLAESDETVAKVDR